MFKSGRRNNTASQPENKKKVSLFFVKGKNVTFGCIPKENYKGNTRRVFKYSFKPTTQTTVTSINL